VSPEVTKNVSVRLMLFVSRISQSEELDIVDIAKAWSRITYKKN
jgi:hypothetical protein